MSTAAPLLTLAAKPQPLSSSAHAGLLLQRKCACGSPAASLTGECGECKSRKRLQTKLTIGTSNDPLEQEADRVADQVMAEPANPAVSGAAPRIQRFTGQATGGVDTAPASVDRVLADSGRPLDSGLRHDMEQRFGYDFSQVRVHTGAAAEQSARDVNAHAYTVGHDIVFGTGRFAPRTVAGDRLLAHELTHVAQQRAGLGLIQRQAKPGAGTGSVLDEYEGRLVQEFDVDRKPNTRPWKLNPLAEAIAKALRASDRAYVQINAVDPSESKDEEHKARAYERADLIRRALIQWIGPQQFSEDRYRIGFSTGTETDPQVQVWIQYKGQVISNPGGVGPPIGPKVPSPVPGPKKPANTGLPDVGLDKITKIETKYVTIKIPQGVTLKTPALAGATSLVISLSGEITDLSKLVNPPAPPTPAPGQPPAPSQPPPIKVGLTMNAKAGENLTFIAQAGGDLGDRSVSAGGGVVIKLPGCELMVPPDIVTKINEAVKLLQANNAFLPEEPPPVNPPPPPPPTPTTARLLQIGQAIDTLYGQLKKVEKLKQECKPQKVQLGATVKVPFGEDLPGQPRGPQLMLTLTLYFN